MTGYALLLHGINVGGNRKVPMARLRQLLTDLGHEQVATHLNSGNAVFASDRSDVDELTAQIRAAVEADLGLDVVMQLRSAAALDRIVADNPLPEAAADPSHFVVVFLSRTPAANWLESFDAERFPAETLVHRADVLYIWYRNGIGTSKLTLASLGKTAKETGTGRNWNTVLTLQSMAAERER